MCWQTTSSSRASQQFHGDLPLRPWGTALGSSVNPARGSWWPMGTTVSRVGSCAPRKKPMKLPCKLISFRNKTTVNFYGFWSRDGVESLTTQPLRNFHQPLNHKNSVDGTRVEEFGSLGKLEGKTMQVWNMYSIATDLYLEPKYIYITKQKHTLYT